MANLNSISFSFGELHYRPYVAKYKRRSRKIQFDNSSYKIYIKRVFRCIHPDMKLSEKAINVLNSFVNDFFDKFALEASFLVKRISKRNTMTDFDIQSAAKLILSGDLKEYAIVEGRKALESFKSHQNMNHNLSYEKYFSFKADINFRRTSSPQHLMF